MRKTKKRRGRGEGSIYQRESDGRWVGSVVVGYDATNGRPLRKNVYGTTKEEAQEKLDELRRKVKAGEPDGEALLFRNALEFWTGDVRCRVDARTVALYRQRVKDHILPHLGHYPVARITPFMVSAWLEELEKKGASAALRAECLKLVRRSLTQCVDYGYLKTNPAKKVSMPRKERREIHPLDADQVRRFLAVARRHRLGALWLLALDSGMRMGEMLALLWEDVDWEAGTVSVTKSVITGKGEKEARVKKPKTKASVRRIRLTGPTLEALAARKKRPGGRLVFGRVATPAGRGTATSTKTPSGRASRGCWPRPAYRKSASTTYGTPTPRWPYRRRRTSRRCHRLGHRDIVITLNTYAHYLPAHEDEYVTAMTRLLTPAETRPAEETVGGTGVATEEAATPRSYISATPASSDRADMTTEVQLGEDVTTRTPSDCP